MTLQPPVVCLEVETGEDAIVVHFRGDSVSLDVCNVPLFSQELNSCMEALGQGKLLVLDLGNVEFLSASALGALIQLHKKRLAEGDGLILRNVRPMIEELFAVTGLTRLFRIDRGEPRIGDQPVGVKELSSSTHAAVQGGVREPFK
jgi:anti-anti-sigma factor